MKKKKKQENTERIFVKFGIGECSEMKSTNSNFG
jgi:hypothetical protein